MLMNDITVSIKTFERPESLKDLLTSIRLFYPTISIIVADDSKKIYVKDIASSFSNVECIPMRFDVGLSAGRNAMLSCIKTKYFVLCDDDFLFFDQTRLEDFKKVLEETDIELVGGCVMDKSDTGEFNKPNLYAGNLVLDSLRNLKMVAINPEGKSFTQCDIVANWFMANTDAVRRKTGGWDPKLKIEEHTDFFWRAKIGGLKVAAVPSVKVNHTLAKNRRYSFYRHIRNDKYYRIYFTKLGLNSFTDRWETVTLKDVQNPWWLKYIIKIPSYIYRNSKEFINRIR